MSLTSYRAAPPRDKPFGVAGSRPVFLCFAVFGLLGFGRLVLLHLIMFSVFSNTERPLFLRPLWCVCVEFFTCVLQTWQRPTLPRLETKYHWRWGVSRPCSEWERVQPPRYNHQVDRAHVYSRSW